MLQLPFFQKLEQSQRVLVAGAGGGFDIFCGLPLYFALRDAGKSVFLANLSFADVIGSSGRVLAPGLVEVTADTVGNERYFPELFLARWFRARGESMSIHAFDRMGPKPLREAYAVLAQELGIDTVLLVDGGTDSLMRGEEFGVGTPLEDIPSILAVDSLGVPHKLLACIGFGIDAFHGVCHAQFLEAVSDVIVAGGYLGCWSLLREMPEMQLYREAAEFTFQCMPHHPSIVSSSILSAAEGEFGDSHSNHRTRGSRLFINPLMALVWCFELAAVNKRILYPRQEMDCAETPGELRAIIEHFRMDHAPRPFQALPM